MSPACARASWPVAPARCRTMKEPRAARVTGTGALRAPQGLTWPSSARRMAAHEPARPVPAWDRVSTARLRPPRVLYSFGDDGRPGSVVDEDPRPQSKNRLLAALPPDEFKRMRPDLEPVRLTTGRLIHQLGRPTTRVYFPVTGMVCLLAAVPDANPIEATIIGREGMTEAITVLAGVTTGTMLAIVQVPGTAYRMSLASVRRHLDDCPSLRPLVGRYAQFMLARVAQTIACDRHHSVIQRTARWLLAAQDNVQSPDFSLSQDFLARMLGTRRATITDAAGALRRAELIRYHYGRITVQDRDGLERAACPCYGIAQHEIDEIFATG